MRLLSLTLNGTYKGLQDQHFDFQQTKGNIVALIGLNGSGKSQLLELIAETFAYLERWQRTDFKNRTPMGFGICVTYRCSTINDVMTHAYYPEFFSDQSNGLIDLRVEIEVNGNVKVSVNQEGQWLELHSNGTIPLPFVIGYSSGLNENLQRSFMKNAVQYFEIMRTRLKRKKELSADLNDDQISEINKRYLKRNSHIFEPEESYVEASHLTTESGEVITTEDGTPIEAENYLLGLREYDTPASKSIYLALL